MTLTRQNSGERAAAAAAAAAAADIPGGAESEPMEVTPEGWLESMQRWFLSFNWLSRVPTPPTVGQPVFIFKGNKGGPPGNKTLQQRRNFTRKDRGKRLPGSVPNVPHTQSQRQPPVMRSGTNNILVSTGASLENLNAGIEFLKGPKCMGSTAMPDFESINQEGVGRTTGGPWTHQELTDEKVRHTLERGGGVTSEKQGGIVYGEKDTQLDWMTLIRSITGNKHSARNHEVEHASKIGQQVMIKTLPFEYSERIKTAGGDHIYKYRQLEEIYKKIIIPEIFGGAQPHSPVVEDFIHDTCYKSCMLSRLMDIYLIVPSIQATNQAKCALNLLSLLLVASIHGFPEPTFEAVRGQAEAIARLILTSIPGTEIFHSGHCSSKTFHNETADWERPQEYDHDKKLNVANVLANLENEVKKLADEIMGNTEILAKFYNKIESTDRQISMAHAITLALTNYITIVHDIFGGTYEPNFRMPLVPLAREAINFLIRFHGAGLRRINFNPVLGVERIVAFYKEAPFVDNDMFLSHLDYYGSPLIPGRTKPPVIYEIPVKADVMVALGVASKKRAPPAAQASNKRRKQKGGEGLIRTIYEEEMGGQKMIEPFTPPRYVSDDEDSPPSDDEDSPPSDDEEIEDDIPEAQTAAQTEAGIKDGTSLSVDEFKSLLSEIEAVVDDNDETWYKIFTAGLEGVFQESSVGEEPMLEDDESGNKPKRSGRSGKKKKKKKKIKSPIQTKRRDQNKEDKRSASSSSKKKKKKKRKQTKKRKQKKSDKIIIDISGLRESLS